MRPRGRNARLGRDAAQRRPRPRSAGGTRANHDDRRPALRRYYAAPDSASALSLPLCASTDSWRNHPIEPCLIRERTRVQLQRKIRRGHNLAGQVCPVRIGEVVLVLHAVRQSGPVWRASMPFCRMMRNIRLWLITRLTRPAQLLLASAVMRR